MKMYFNKRWMLIVTALLGVSYFVSRSLVDFYPVTDVHFYNQIKLESLGIDDTTLVLFDVDDTLLSTHDVFARGSYYPWSLMVLAFFRFPYFLNISRFEEAYSIVLSQAPRVLIDSSVVGLINRFKKHKAIVLGLTKIETGSFGVVCNIADWRYRMLHNMGIHFTRKFENRKFTSLDSYRGYYPELYNGIMLTNRQAKDKVLAEFLDYADLKPSKIIFFDDKKSNLQQIGSLCYKRNIPCKLYHVRIVDAWSQEWNISKIFKQIKILSREKRWVSASELAEY